MLTLDLNNRVVAVTGGFGSLGAAVGRAAIAAGARVALLDRADDSRHPEDLSGALGVGAADLASPAGATDAVGRVVARLGRLDALVNVAGGFRWEKFEGGDPATWDHLYEMNVRTAVCASQAALPHLLASGAGRIVNVGALAASKAGTGMGAYAASKAAVAKLTESLADEFRDRDVTVNAVLPSIIDTPANRADMPDADFSRWVQPGQIADLVVFLLSDRAAAITGALIPVAGRV
ncbi:MAG: SDR family NAD(P)-dependent oxidoreductase [Betaproteobacteria bacterium]|nr:SDR family NAD(P)-dependent oxidoreductase [Betaproteobacteria bacterium]